MENVIVFDHPLIQHKISILRNKNTGTNEFRALIEEIATLMGYEALRDLPLEDVKVETPLETCMSPMIAGRKLAIVPILRAGLGMVMVFWHWFQVQRLAISVFTEMKRLMSRTNIIVSFRTLLKSVPSLLLTLC